MDDSLLRQQGTTAIARKSVGVLPLDLHPTFKRATWVLINMTYTNPGELSGTVLA